MSDGEQDDTEVQARALGWAPKEDWRGAEEKWVDAATFLDKGRKQMPILLENNRRMAGELQDMRGKVGQLQALVQAGMESMDELKKFHASDVERAVARERTRLKGELKAAREDGDTDRELEIHEEIADLAQLKNAGTTEKKPAANDPPQQQQQPVIDPDFIQWQQQPENAWFGVDKRKTSLAVGIAEDLRTDPKHRHLKGYDFYEKVSEELDAYLGTPTRRADKVDGGRPSGNGGGGGGGNGKRSFATLPADAKAACASQGKKLVGPGRAFKTEAEWQAHYVEQYYRGE